MNKILSVTKIAWRRLTDLYSAYPYGFLLLVVLGYSGWHILFLTTSRDNAIPLWLMALIMSYRCVRSLGNQMEREGKARISAWVMLALIPFCLQIPSVNGLPVNSLLSVFLVALSIVSYCYGLYAVLCFLPFLLLTLIIIPVQEQLLLALSYPLRLISTKFTVWVLQLFGNDITHHLTTIRLESYNIAVTDACSGISQIAVLMLLGYIIVTRTRYQNLYFMIIHYIALVPIVIIANTIRLVLTILLFYLIREKAFSNIYHASLGFVFVIFSTVLFYWTGWVFPKKEENSDAAPEGETENLQEDL